MDKKAVLYAAFPFKTGLYVSENSQTVQPHCLIRVLTILYIDSSGAVTGGFFQSFEQQIIDSFYVETNSDHYRLI